MNQQQLADCRTIYAFHRDMAQLHRDNGNRSAAKAAQRRANEARHALQRLRQRWAR